MNLSIDFDYVFFILVISIYYLIFLSMNLSIDFDYVPFDLDYIYLLIFLAMYLSIDFDYVSFDLGYIYQSIDLLIYGKKIVYYRLLVFIVPYTFNRKQSNHIAKLFKYWAKLLRTKTRYKGLEKDFCSYYYYIRNY